MGDSACLMHGFSYASAIPNESIQGYNKHALGDSISFGRFMTDQSLSWDKWSMFSHKKYVEEAERYAQPGSVAEKKAFFEAHYKKIAAQKAAALLEQENAAKTEAEGVRNDNNAYVEEQRDNLNSHSDVDVKMEVVKIQGAKEDSINQLENHENHAKQNSVASEDIPLKTTIQSKTWEIPSTPPKQVHLKKDNNVNRSKTGPKWHILSAICSKSSTACRNKLQSPNRSTSFILGTEERAAKMKQEKARNKLRKLSCTFCFKARRPLPDENEAPKDQMKKTTAAQPQSAVLGRSISNKTQGTISMPPPPPPPRPTCLAKSTASKNLPKTNVLNQGKTLTNSLPERITHENASPNIQQ